MDIDDLPAGWRLILLLARDHVVAYMKVPSYDGTIGELIAAGWLVRWTRIDGHFVTLSPWAAERLDVELDEFGPQDTPRWVPIRYDLDGERMEITRPHVQPVERGMVRLGSVDYLPLERREIDELARIVKAKEKAKAAKRKQRELRRKSA